MTIKRLTIQNLRNLQAVELALSPRINLFYGANGAGKTSLLEAVHLLSLARSFRTSKHRHYIRYDQPDCTLFAQVVGNNAENLPVGLQRQRDGQLRIRIAGENIAAVSTLAELLPVQLINSDTFLLLEGSPEIRRQFLDWGGFHSESRFLATWKAVRRCLKQRNSLLKCGKMDPFVRAVWDRELVTHSECLDSFRQAYFLALQPVFEELLSELVEIEDITLQYYRGWDQRRELDEVLASGFERDHASGFTHQGTQRADLRVKVKGIAASEVLSRGQQKLTVCAMKMAQGFLLREQTGLRCAYLIDDLPAELDMKHRRRLCEQLERLETQVLVTCVEPEAFSGCWQQSNDVRAFPISQGALVTNEQ